MDLKTTDVSDVETTETLAFSKKYRDDRVKLIEAAYEQGLNPYPHKFTITKTFRECITSYSGIDPGARLLDVTESVGGRVAEIREASGKLVFMTCFSDGYTLQYMFDKRLYGDQEKFLEDIRKVNRGDIVGVTGHVGKSHKGELSIFPKSVTILTPCLQIIPKQYIGIKDPDLQVKKRYLDMVVNKELITTLKTKALIIQSIRDYLNGLNFTEVNTAILSGQAGGANAKPFTTYHNDLHADMFMRIAPELFLKQLVVGGMERVYEIGPQFRNENLSYRHNPEFISLEYYMAFADYNDIMTMTEELLSQLVYKVKGSLKFTYGDLELDFTPPFQRIDFMGELQKHLGAFPSDYESEEMREFLIQKCLENNVECSKPKTISRLLDKLAGHFIEPQCKNPTFLINHPLIMSPLAKWHRDDPRLTERFELFANYFELCNAYTELNNPLVQRKTFEKQMKDKKEGCPEAQSIDENFINALEVGLPPTGGFGLGIERLVMLLTNKHTIRDVIAFPAYKV